MNIELLREIINQSMTLDHNDDFGQEVCWNKMIGILSTDISATLIFFESDCTDEELYWLGPVFEDMAEKTQSKELIQVLRKRLAEVKPENYRQQDFKSELLRKWVDYAEYMRSVSVDIDYAEDRIISEKY